jgi:hypothetical protein
MAAEHVTVHISAGGSLSSLTITHFVRGLAFGGYQFACDALLLSTFIVNTWFAFVDDGRDIPTSMIEPVAY